MVYGADSSKTTILVGVAPVGLQALADGATFLGARASGSAGDLPVGLTFALADLVAVAALAAAFPRDAMAPQTAFIVGALADPLAAVSVADIRPPVAASAVRRTPRQDETERERREQAENGHRYSERSGLVMAGAILWRW